MSTEKHNNKYLLKIKEFWLKYEPRFILSFAFLLVAVLAFEAGVMSGQKTSKSPLVVEKPAQCENISDSPQNSQKSQDLTPENNSNKIGEEVPKTCQFVASKNSDKYHKNTCTVGKKIKPENQVCFSNEQEAENKGYTKAGCCFK